MGVVWHKTAETAYLKFYDDEAAENAVAAFDYADIVDYHDEEEEDGRGGEIEDGVKVRVV